MYKNATIFRGDPSVISAQTKALVSLLTASAKFDSFFQMLKIRCPGSCWLVGLYSSEALPGILHGDDVKRLIARLSIIRESMETSLKFYFTGLDSSFWVHSMFEQTC